MTRKEENRPRYVIEEIPLDLIDYEEQQVRDVQVDDDIHELASTITALDLLQFPGVVKKPAGRYALAWGRRRLEAFRLMKKPTIPCRIYEGDLESIKALALVENLQRRQMSIDEECRGVDYLYNVKKLPIDTIVQQLGRTRSWVNQRLAVPSFPAEIRDALLDGTIALGSAEALAICDDDSTRSYILSQAIHQKLTVNEVRGLVQAAKELPPQNEAIEAGLAVSRETFSYQPQLIVCAACNTPRPLDKLQFVRVCNDGCRTHSEPDANGTPSPDGLDDDQLHRD